MSNEDIFNTGATAIRTLERSPEGNEEILKTGTTTIGMKIKDGVILASDQRATMSNYIAHSNVQKVYPLSENLGMTIAGVVGDALLVVRYIQSEVAIYSMKRGSPMSVKAAAVLVGNVMRNGFYLGLIVGGYDTTGGHIFSVDAAGGYIEDDFTAIGSGSTIAMGSLEGSYKKNMTKKEAIDAAITALNSSRRRDSASGDGMLISYIGPKGYEEIPQDQIKARCGELGFNYPN